MKTWILGLVFLVGCQGKEGERPPKRCSADEVWIANGVIDSMSRVRVDEDKPTALLAYIPGEVDPTVDADFVEVVPGAGAVELNGFASSRCLVDVEHYRSRDVDDKLERKAMAPIRAIGNGGPDELVGAWVEVARRSSALATRRLRSRALRVATYHSIRAGYLQRAGCFLFQARGEQSDARDLLGWGHGEALGLQLVAGQGRLLEALHVSSRWIARSLPDSMSVVRTRFAWVGAHAAMELGEWSEAQAFLDDLEAVSKADGNLRGELAARHSRVWLEMLQFASGSRSTFNTTLLDSLRDSRSQYLKLRNVDNVFETLADEAWILLQMGRLPEVEDTLEELDELKTKVGEPLFAESFVELVRGWWALKTRRFALARKSFDQARAISVRRAPGVPSEATWQGAWGQAAVLRARGKKRPAAQAYGAALDEMLALGIRGGGDTAPFLGSKRRFLDEMVDALLSAGETELAYRLTLALDRLVLGPGLADQALQPAEAETPEPAWPSTPEGCLALEPPPPVPPAAPTRSWSDDKLPPLAEDEAFVALQLRGGHTELFLQRPQGVTVQRWDPQAPLAWTRGLEGVRHLYLSSNRTHDKGQLVFAERGKLLERFTVSLVPHAAVLSRPAIEVAEGQLAVFGTGANFDTELEEKSMIRKAGFELREGRGLAVERLETDTLFFSGHGVLDTGSLWASHLLLAPDRELTLADWLALRPKVRFAVVSACTTASPVREASGHWFGFAEGMLEAGTDTVLAARGEVPTAEALSFMRTFLKHEGMTQPAEGYRRTVRELAARNDPAWSRFLLFGRRGNRSLSKSEDPRR